MSFFLVYPYFLLVIVLSLWRMKPFVVSHRWLFDLSYRILTCTGTSTTESKVSLESSGHVLFCCLLHFSSKCMMEVISANTERTSFFLVPCLSLPSSLHPLAKSAKNIAFWAWLLIFLRTFLIDLGVPLIETSALGAANCIFNPAPSSCMEKMNASPSTNIFLYSHHQFPPMAMLLHALY